MMPQDVGGDEIGSPFSGVRAVQPTLPDVAWPKEPPEPRWCTTCNCFHRPASCMEDTN